MGANALNRRQQAALTSAYVLVQSSYKEYKGKLKELYGEEAHNAIIDSIAKEMLIFDEDLMTFAMSNCITLEDTNGNRKLLKKRYEQKIDAVAAMMDAYIAYKLNRDAFE